MILKLVSNDDSVLREVIPDFDFTNPPCDPIELARNLTETMIYNRGIGLAANQVGLKYRVFVLSSNPVYACFNPRVVDSSNNNQIVLDEGCLSFPNLYLQIKRPRTIKVRFVRPDGETITTKFDGITARCFLHELDHLNGITFTSKSNKYHLDKAYRYKKQLDRGHIKEMKNV